jgi:hypothetical protein
MWLLKISSNALQSILGTCLVVTYFVVCLRLCLARNITFNLV